VSVPARNPSLLGTNPHADNNTFAAPPHNSPLWTKTYWETDAEGVARVMRGLASVWTRAPAADVVSITAHSGAIRYMQAGLGHPVFRLVPGAVLPVIVRGERV
jgi:broad specificity phosphatase PhoE